MDSTDNIETRRLSDENKMVGDKEDRNWQSRLRLRKTAVQPPTMQSGDKHGSKKIEEPEQPIAQTCPIKAQQSRHVTNIPGDILRFRCSECKDKREFSPNDLLGHFQERHQGCRPCFSCNMCTFNTHKVSCLEVHVLGHKDTFGSCIICNDNVQRTLLELTTHVDMHHRVNGCYLCDRCKFSASDMGAFLEHMHLHSLTLRDKGCADIITKHITTVHGEEKCQPAKQTMKEIHHKTVGSSPRLRQRWKRNTVKGMCWMSQDCLSVSGREFLEKYCNLSGPEKALEETQHFLERSVVAETAGEKWTKALQSVLSNVPQDITNFSVLENGTTSNPGLPNTGNDLTVLTVKNKISVPQHGSPEAKGLKMLEGRRNMLSKVMTSGKTSPTMPSETYSEDSHSTVDARRCQFNLTSIQNEFVECNQSLENGENQRIRSVHKDHGEQVRQHEESQNANHCEVEAGEFIELKLRKERSDNGEKSSIETLPRPKNKKRRRKAFRPKIVNSKPENANHCEVEAGEFIELKLRKERSENGEKSTIETLPCSENKKRRRKAFRPKIVNSKPAPGLKIFLKKDPVKERQWTSQCPFPLTGGGLLEGFQSLQHPQRTLEETQIFLQRALSTESGGKKWIKATKADHQQNIPKVTTPSSTSTPQAEPKEDPIPNPGHHNLNVSDLSVLMTQSKTSVPPVCTTNTMGFKMVDGKRLIVNTLSVITPSEQETQDETEEALLSMETEVVNTTSVCCTNNLSSAEDNRRTNAEFPPGAFINSDLYSHVENAPLQNTNVSFSPENTREINDGANATMDGKPPAQGVMMPVTPTPPFLSLPQGMTNVSEHADHSPYVSTVTGKRQREASSDNVPDPLSKANRISCSQSKDLEYHWEPAPKHVERTLTLLPANPTQLIKCPGGVQPVVVLNHPDAEIPEVTNIMEIVHRYKGHVQKVALSQTTLNALSTMDCETAARSDLTKSRSPSQRHRWPENSVKERFVLKLKLKKTSRKKYKVVDTVSHCTDPPVRFSCWFCGRVFRTQEMWISHGQRHLVAWKRESSET